MVIRFDGQTVVVTGAGHGLGRSHAWLFAARGAHVAVHDAGVDADGMAGDRSVADAVVAEIRNSDGSASAAYQNLLTREGCRSLAVRCGAGRLHRLR